MNPANPNGLDQTSQTETIKPTSKGTLLRVLGVGFGLAVTIGGTIGMGILRTPGEVATQLPTPALYSVSGYLAVFMRWLRPLSRRLGAMIPRQVVGMCSFIERSEIIPDSSLVGAIGCRRVERSP